MSVQTHIIYAVKTLLKGNKCFFSEMEVITVLTCMILLYHFQWETCCLHLKIIFTEEYRGLTESFITWCNHNHLKLNISKITELVVDYQRNRRPLVLVVIQGEEVKRVDSYKYLGVQINKWWPKKCFSRSLWHHSEFDLWPSGQKFLALHHFIQLDICVKFCQNERMNSIMVMAKNVFCEVTVTLTIHPWVQVNICAKFEEIPLRRSWDTAFTRMGWTDGQTTRKHNASGPGYGRTFF